MSDFEALDKPSETVTGREPEQWYVSVSHTHRRCLLNACFVMNIDDAANPAEELYYENEAEAYACMEEYYDRHNEDFPYRIEMINAELRDGYRTEENDEESTGQQVMEFV